MKLYKFYIVILIILSSLNLQAQPNSNAHPKKHRFAFYAGAGPNYYFNNLATSKTHVDPWNHSFAGRFMWQPEHFLSLGIESGYYQLYTDNYFTQTFGTTRVKNIAIPIQIVVSTTILKNYYVNFSMGQTRLLNQVSNSGLGKIDAGSWSLADFGAAAGYKYIFKNRVSLGVETKFFYSTKYRDSNLALMFMAGYNF
ncbi:MAG TPA: hypothetical protein VMI12_06820 [Puia sp.]|nr:hypothetical protein [Puia sp.]